MEEEFRFHLDMETARLVREGLSPDEARRRALVSFGGMDTHRETMRDERGARWFDDLGADLRYALRGMRRSPGFALAVALTLGVGIGVNGIVVGYVNAILFRPIPAPAPEQLVALFLRDTRTGAARPARVRGVSRFSRPQWRVRRPGRGDGGPAQRRHSQCGGIGWRAT